jgi:hypothetical protein
MDVTVKIEIPGKGGCQHKKVTLTRSDGKVFTRVFTDDEILPEEKYDETETWNAAMPLIRQEAKRFKTPVTVDESKPAIEAGDYKI